MVSVLELALFECFDFMGFVVDIFVEPASFCAFLEGGLLILATGTCTFFSLKLACFSAKQLFLITGPETLWARAELLSESAPELELFLPIFGAEIYNNH